MDSATLDSKLVSIEGEIRNFIQKHNSRMLAVEQKLTSPGGGHRMSGSDETIGALLTASDGFKAFKGGLKSSGQVQVGHFHKDALAIVNATGLDQPLAPYYRVPGIVTPGLQRLTVRDLLTAIPVTANMVAYAKETAFTNSAAPQAGENVLKAESGITFALANAPVQTIAHWIPASRQILEDAPALEAYINSRLVYGLKLAEEGQLLAGDGTGNNLSGLIANSTPFDTTRTVSGDTFIDTLQRAMTQAEDESLFEVDGIVVNNLDWAALQLIKDTLGRYIYSDPQSGAPARLWGKLVVPTKSMHRGSFLVGAFRQAAAIWDRDDATVEVSREHADFFIRNMVAILCEERLALTVFRSLALVYGWFPFGS